MSGPNCLISLGLTFNDVVLCCSKTMKNRHKTFPSTSHFLPFFVNSGHKFLFDSGLGSPNPPAQGLDTKKEEAFSKC